MTGIEIIWCLVSLDATDGFYFLLRAGVCLVLCGGS